MNCVKHLSKEIGIASVLGVGFVAMKQFSHKPISDSLLENMPELKNSPLANVLIELQSLGCHSDFEILIKECEELLVLSKGDDTSLGYQFRANRKLTDIERICDRMCDEAKRSGDFNRIDAALVSMVDHIPQVKEICNMHLLNMLM